MITIIPYQPIYQADFERLNKAWLITYFNVEPIDEFVLTQPEEAILKDGGQVLFARSDDTIVGTVALKKASNSVIEMTKMAVDDKHQGKGIGKMLCAAAISTARHMGAKKLILFSHRKLEAALALYRANGFREIPVTPGIYKRADIMMELDLMPNRH